MPFLRSETVHQLRQILDYLPRQRRRALLLLVPFSVIPGVLDLLSVAVVARLTGAALRDSCAARSFAYGRPARGDREHPWTR